MFSDGPRWPSEVVVQPQRVSQSEKQLVSHNKSLFTVSAEAFHTILQGLAELEEALRKLCLRPLENCRGFLSSFQMSCLPLLSREAGNVFSFWSEQCKGPVRNAHRATCYQLPPAVCHDLFHFSWGHQVLWDATSDFTRKTKQTLPVGLQRATSLKAELLFFFRRGRNKIWRSASIHQIIPETADKAIKTNKKQFFFKKKNLYF